MKAEGSFQKGEGIRWEWEDEKVMGVLENDQKYMIGMYEIAKGSQKKFVFMGHLS